MFYFQHTWHINKDMNNKLSFDNPNNNEILTSGKLKIMHLSEPVNYILILLGNIRCHFVKFIATRVPLSLLLF